MIVVTAPTSRIGSGLVSRLPGDASVRVVARDPSRLPAEVREPVEVVTGSHADPDVIAAALDGADSVFWLVPPDSTTDDIVEHYRRFTRPFCDVLAADPGPRMVRVTTMGTHYRDPAGHLTAERPSSLRWATEPSSALSVPSPRLPTARTGRRGQP